MNTRMFLSAFAAAALAMGGSAAAVAASSQGQGFGHYTEDNSPTGDAVVDASFNPYAKSMPSFEGYKPGMVINQSNVDQFKSILTNAQYLVIKKGWYKMHTIPTFSMMLPKSFREATKADYKNVKIDPKTGNLDGYVAGRPFPEDPSKDDPQAGLKLAWNFQHGLNWGDNGTIKPFYFNYRDLQSGSLDRTVQLAYHTINFMHRFQNPPIPNIEPNPAGIYRAIYLRVSEPNALRNTQLLIQRHEDDRRQDSDFIYLGFQRRVRRLPAAQTTDSFLGSDLMIQDFEGYNDRVGAMKWTYLGTKYVMTPLYRHNKLKLSNEHPADGYHFVAFGGQGQCFPNINWQLRKVYILEGVPVSKSSPIGKRIIYMDAQTGALPQTDIYDKKGQLWKDWTIGKTDPDYQLPGNKGSGIPIDDSFFMVDLEAKHCTTGQFKGRVNAEENPPSMFTTQHMRNVGGGN
ncbi:MAG: DUF1329 domain-containing protein [Sinobacteraceae bacterium]|nr:DUF1329 domain-containing protein [Nevskiaceae bacterium]